MTAAHSRQVLLLLRLLFLGLIAAVLYLSLSPVATAQGPNADKIHHFAAFYALALAGLAAFPRTNPLILAAGLCAFGGLIEVLQGLPAIGRYREVMDWVADIIGVLLALAPLSLARWRGRSGPAA